MNLRCSTRNSVITLACLMLSGTLALAQPPNDPAQNPAPVERQTPGQAGGPRMYPGYGGMARPGMGGQQGGRPDFRGPGMGGRGNFGGGRNGERGGFRGHEGFGGGPMGREMGGGLHMGPGGMWWKNPMMVQRLNLTAEQTRKMDGIFQESRLQLIDLKANLERQEVMLEPLMSASPFDSGRAMEQIDKVAQARADLEKGNAKMLLGIRAVLTPEQWTNLKERRGPGNASAPAPAARTGRTRGLRGNSPGTAPQARPSSGATPQ